MIRNKLTWLAAAMLAALLVVAPDTARGQDSGAAPAITAPAKKRNTVPFTGKLVAVDLVEKSITLSGKSKQRVFYVTPETRIQKGGNPATLEAATVGDSVGGLARVNADGKAQVVSLRLGPKPEGAEANGKAKTNSTGAE